MKASIKVDETNLEVLYGLEAEAELRHVEFDKVIVDTSSLTFELFHRNFIFEKDHIRLVGFVLVHGVMGKAEILVKA